MKLLVLNGPNLNMLGIREPNIYGKESYPQLVKLVEDTCRQLGVEVEVYQSNHEGDLVDKIQAAYGAKDAIVINPAAYTHTSVAILDALKEGAMTHFTPQDLMARGACSRLEPQPKLGPATIMSPSSTVEAKSGSMSSMQWEARAAGEGSLR